MNAIKNEHIIKLGEVEILLRPTFENIEAVETALGAVSYLGWKYSSYEKTFEQKVKSLPPATELAKIIYYSQAAKKEDGTYKLSLNEIWEMLIDNGIKREIINGVIIFLGKMTVGAKFNSAEEVVAEEKKT